jgi:hypothetical protein
VPDLTAIQVARRSYDKWKTLVPFEKDLRDYLEEGIVVSRSDVFLMAKVVDRRPKDKDGNPIGERIDPALFVRMGVGNLSQLLITAASSTAPVFVPWLRFCRRGDQRVREYGFDRLAKTAIKMRKKESNV